MLQVVLVVDCLLLTRRIATFACEIGSNILGQTRGEQLDPSPPREHDAGRRRSGKFTAARATPKNPSFAIAQHPTMTRTSFRREMRHAIVSILESGRVALRMLNLPWRRPIGKARSAVRSNRGTCLDSRQCAQQHTIVQVHATDDSRGKHRPVNSPSSCLNSIMTHIALTASPRATGTRMHTQRPICKPSATPSRLLAGQSKAGRSSGAGDWPGSTMHTKPTRGLEQYALHTGRPCTRTLFRLRGLVTASAALPSSSVDAERHQWFAVAATSAHPATVLGRYTYDTSVMWQGVKRTDGCTIPRRMESQSHRS